MYFPEGQSSAKECAVCECKSKTRRCTGCKMVSYCGRDHQLKDWPNHKSFCKAILEILKEKQLSHIFENLPRGDLSTWTKEKEKVSELVKTKLGRSLTSKETALLQFPRDFSGCLETKQQKLKVWPGSSAVGFYPRNSSLCFSDLHPNNEVHAMISSSKNVLSSKTQIASKPNLDSYSKKSLMKLIAEGTKILTTEDHPPTSITDFFDNFTIPNSKVSQIEKSALSEFFNMSLLIFSVLQKIYDHFPAEIVVHFDAGETILNGKYWESLLHLLPGVKILKIVHIEGKIMHMNHISLCNNCITNKRKLFVEANSMSYELYMTERDYQNPSLIAYLNISPPEYKRIEWLNTIRRWCKVSCPMLLTMRTERKFKMIEQDLQDSGLHFRIIFKGSDEFAAEMYNFEEDTQPFAEQFCGRKNSQFMIVFKREESSSTGDSSINRDQLINHDLSITNRPRSCFYPTICHVCRKANPKLTCNRCRIVSYCTNKHRDQDQIHHKDICKAILSLLSEMGTTNLFDKIKLSEPELWLRGKIELMKKVAVKLGRKLEEYEEQMFLFPKVCAVCHDSDLSVLRNCKCGVCLCKVHTNDWKHKKICEELFIAFKTSISEKRPLLEQKLQLPLNASCLKIPPTMEQYIKLYCISTKKQKISDSIDYQALVASNFLTSPLTLHYVLKKLKKEINSSMVVHIIGANRSDLISEPAWKIFLYSLEQLKTLKVIFIGQEISNCPEVFSSTSDCSMLGEKFLSVECRGMKYKQYFSSKSFIKPNIIMSCNVNIHESELGISQDTWKEDISVLAEMQNVSFILTAGSKERAEKDHNVICSYFDKPINHTFFEKNPFASLNPERDFVTEGVIYPNKCIIAYENEFKN